VIIVSWSTLRICWISIISVCVCGLSR